MRNLCQGIIGCLIKNNYNFSMRPAHIPSGMLNKKQTSHKKRKDVAFQKALSQHPSDHSDNSTIFTATIKTALVHTRREGAEGKKASLSLPAENHSPHLSLSGRVNAREFYDKFAQQRGDVHCASRLIPRRAEAGFSKRGESWNKNKSKKKINGTGEMAKIKNKLDEMMARSKTFNSIFSFA